jgi:foldase protein PrsA
MQRNKAKVLLVLMLAVVLVISGCGKSKESKQVVATYKDGEVTQAEFDTFKGVITVFNPQLSEQAADKATQENLLKQLIAYKILNEKADKPAKEAGEKKAKEQIDQIDTYFKTAVASGQPSLDSLLKAQKVTKDDMVQFLEQDEIARQYMGSKVTDEQIKAEFDKNLASDKNFYDYATVSHILVAFEKQDGTKLEKKDALIKANEIKAKLDAGGDFAALAKEFSDDPGSKDKGGTYPDAAVSQWVPEFKKAALELPLNKISDPVETSYGYHIMKVESRTTKKLEDMKVTLREGIASTKMSEFLEKELPGLITKITLPEIPAAKDDKAGTEDKDATTPTPTPTPSTEPAKK